MKVATHVVNPDTRTRTIREIADRFGFTEAEQLSNLRLAMTPPALRHLPDHSGRGQKSLGRIQQINNRRLFKRRPTASR